MSEETRPYTRGSEPPGVGWFLENKETHKPVTRTQKARANSAGVFKQGDMNVVATDALQWKKGRVVGETKKGKKAREEKEAKVKAAEEKRLKKQVGRKAATQTAAKRASLPARVEKLMRNYTLRAQDARRRGVPFNASMRGSLGLAFTKPPRMTKKQAQRLVNAKRSENLAANLRRKADALEARITLIRAAAAAEKERIEEAAKLIRSSTRHMENENDDENNSANNMGAQAAVEAELARIEEEKLKEAAKIMQKAKGKNEYRVYDDSDDEEEENISPKKKEVLSAILEENNSNLTASEKNALNALADRMRRV